MTIGVGTGAAFCKPLPRFKIFTPHAASRAQGTNIYPLPRAEDGSFAKHMLQSQRWIVTVFLAKT